MKILCVVIGGCRWHVIREEWLPASATYETVRLLRFHECRHCRDTRATITSPKVSETTYAKPHRTMQFSGSEA